MITRQISSHCHAYTPIKFYVVGFNFNMLWSCITSHSSCRIWTWKQHPNSSKPVTQKYSRLSCLSKQDPMRKASCFASNEDAAIYVGWNFLLPIGWQDLTHAALRFAASQFGGQILHSSAAPLIPLRSTKPHLCHHRYCISISTHYKYNS